LDKEPAIIVGEPGSALHLTPQKDQLMSERHVLCFKPTLRLEWRGQDGQDEAEQRKHYALTLGDSFSRSNADGVFGTHKGPAGGPGGPRVSFLFSAALPHARLRLVHRHQLGSATLLSQMHVDLLNGHFPLPFAAMAVKVPPSVW
jgi:hypothetical protein